MEGKDPMNANLIGIQHGQLQHYLDRIMEDNPEKFKAIKERLDLYRKLVLPLQIVTPFQLLKYFYGVKAFEMGMTNLVGAKLIFDEIHAYDTVTFAQIVVMLKFLISKFNCKVFIMTATLPTFMIEILQDAIGKHTLIKAAKALQERLKRHKVEVFEGDIWDAIEEKRNTFEGKRVIIVCNTVKMAQECYGRVKEAFLENKITLLHGRFNRTDRSTKEEEALSEETEFLIGTQAIEVSLDIDYDMMITELAPIDALLQRFGRVNRRVKKKPCPIFVCSESSGVDGKIYSEERSEKTLEVLKEVEFLDESMVQELVDQVYPSWTDKEEAVFNETITLFEHSLHSLQPFEDNMESEEEFYKKFTGVQVLPAKYLSQYKQYLLEGEYLKAEGLMVGIHQAIFRYLRAEQRITLERIPMLKEDSKTVDENVLVTKCYYDSEIGLDTGRQEVLIYDDTVL
jgi:CRISPR-associated endonuclease/helicase Cas3